MLDPERTTKLDALSKEIMVAEIAAGRYSAYNEESRAYMQKRLAVMGAQAEQQTVNVRVAQLEQAAAANEIVRESNTIGREGNLIVKTGARWTGWQVAIALLAVAVSVLLFLLYEHR